MATVSSDAALDEFTHLQEALDQFAHLQKEALRLQFDLDKGKNRVGRLKFIWEVRSDRYKFARECSKVLQAHKRSWPIRKFCLSLYSLSGVLKVEVAELNRLKLKQDRSRRHAFSEGNRITSNLESRALELKFRFVDFQTNIRSRRLSGHTSEELDNAVVAIQSTLAETTNGVADLVRNATQDATSETEGEELVGKPRLTTDQFILLMFAIGGSRIKGLDKGKVAEGLSALTGRSTKSFIKRFSMVLPTDKDGIKKFSQQTDAWNKDVEVVGEILTRMGLTDEVNKLKENSNL